MYRFSEKHISKAEPSFRERLEMALESSRILSVKIDTKPLLKKKYKRYKISETDFLYRSDKNKEIR